MTFNTISESLHPGRILIDRPPAVVEAEQRRRHISSPGFSTISDALHPGRLLAEVGIGLCNMTQDAYYDLPGFLATVVRDIIKDVGIIVGLREKVNDTHNGSDRPPAVVEAEQRRRHISSPGFSTISDALHPDRLLAEVGIGLCNMMQDAYYDLPGFLATVVRDIIKDVGNIVSPREKVDYTYFWTNKGPADVEAKQQSRCVYIWWDENEDPKLPAEEQMLHILPERVALGRQLGQCLSDLNYLKVCRDQESAPSDVELKRIHDHRMNLLIHMSFLKNLCFRGLPQVREARDVLNELFDILPLDGQRKKTPPSIPCQDLSGRYI